MFAADGVNFWNKFASPGSAFAATMAKEPEAWTQDDAVVGPGDAI